MAVAISKEDQDLRESLSVKPPTGVVDWINMLVYGEAGVGKTYLGGTAEDSKDMSPLLVFDVEGGVTTLRKRQGIDVIPIRTMKDIQDNYNKLYTSIKGGKIYYKTIMIDSLTELADVDMKSIMKDAYRKNPDKVDEDVPSPREWGKTRNHIRLIVRAFRDLPCHVLYTAHVRTYMEEGQPTRHYPGFAGQLAKEIPGFMDIVGYYYAETEPGSGVITRKLQTQGTRRVVAKDRTASLSDVEEDPTLPSLWAKIHA
jgi:phage nucleotide-binding protein